MLDSAAQAPLAATTFAAVVVAAQAGNAVVLPDMAPAPRLSSRLIVLAALCAALAQLQNKDTFGGLADLFLLAALAYFSVFDARFMAAPVIPVVGLIAGGLALAWLISPDIALAHASAAAAGVISFLLLDVVFRLLRGQRGLGEGDALIAGVIGAWLSWEGLIWSVAIGASLGALFVLARGDAKAPLPFVPALSAGVVVFLCNGAQPW